jgi:hypothetical protein
MDTVGIAICVSMLALRALCGKRAYQVSFGKIRELRFDQDQIYSYCDGISSSYGGLFGGFWQAQV